MQLGQEGFCDPSGLNVLPDNDSLIPMNIVSGGLEDSRFQYYDVDIGSRDCGMGTCFGDDWEECDTEEIWDVIQSGQYKSNYRMFFSECSTEELIAYAQQLLRRADWLNQQEQELFGTGRSSQEEDARKNRRVVKFKEDGMGCPPEAQFPDRVPDINPFGREFEEQPLPLVARSEMPLPEGNHINDIDRNKAIGLSSPPPIMSGMLTPMFESPGGLLTSFGSIQMAPLSPNGAILPSSNNPYAEMMPYAVEENTYPLGLKESHTNNSIASLMGTMTEMIRRAKEGSNSM